MFVCSHQCSEGRRSLGTDFVDMAQEAKEETSSRLRAEQGHLISNCPTYVTCIGNISQLYLELQCLNKCVMNIKNVFSAIKSTLN